MFYFFNSLLGVVVGSYTAASMEDCCLCVPEPWTQSLHSWLGFTPYRAVTLTTIGTSEAFLGLLLQRNRNSVVKKKTPNPKKTHHQQLNSKNVKLTQLAVLLISIYSKNFICFLKRQSPLLALHFLNWNATIRIWKGKDQYLI